MLKVKRHLILVSAVFAFSSLSQPAGASLIEYSYTGNPYTQLSIPSADYSTMITQAIPLNYPVTSLSFWFTVDDSLVNKNGQTTISFDSNSPSYNPSVLQSLQSFSFTDGYNTLSSALGNRQTVSATFDTDANGNIVGSWSVFASSKLFIQMASTAGGSVVQDYTSAAGLPAVYGSSNRPNSVFVNNDPGVWTQTLVTTVPIGSAFWLFGSVITAFSFSRRRYAVYQSK
jgi:hypothetical protein